MEALTVVSEKYWLLISDMDLKLASRRTDFLYIGLREYAALAIREKFRNSMIQCFN